MFNQRWQTFGFVFATDFNKLSWRILDGIVKFFGLVENMIEKAKSMLQKNNAQMLDSK